MVNEIITGKRALITGINGQDGSYLAELLINKGYQVWGTLKRNSLSETQTSRLPEQIFKKVKLIYADLTDIPSLVHAINESQPDELYNLAAQSHVRVSFDQPVYTAQATGVGVLNVLEAVRMTNKNIKVYQASSSEMFGNSIESDGFQRETTPMRPVSPYGCAKVYAFNICVNYRNSYDMFISNGILFNHESPRRGTNFVTNKVARAAAQIKLGLKDELVMGNMEATRDWGHAKDYVNAMWLILQHDQPDDFIHSTGVSHTVQHLADYCFSRVGLDSAKYVKQHEKYLRPEELHHLKGDCTKAKNTLGWKHDYTFETMMDEMVDYWLDFYSK